MNISFRRLSLKRRVWVALALITLLPVIVLFYYFADFKITPLTVGILVGIVLLGWWIVFEVFSSVLRIYNQSRESLPGGRTKTAKEAYAGNEVEQLGSIFNMLSSKMKESVDELKAVSAKTEELNRAINQKVEVLSSILQANILFSKGSSSKDIFQFLTDHLRGIIEVSRVLTILKKQEQEIHYSYISGIERTKVDEIMESKELGALVKVADRLIIDSEHKQPKFSTLLLSLEVKNLIINPIYLKEKVIGFLLVGNHNEDFTFSSEELETIELFSRNMSIVWEHERLSRRVEDLEIFDPLTRVYNGKYFFKRLDEEIKRASTYQRPCGVLTVEIVNYSEYQEDFGLIELERILKQIVQIFRDNIRPIDILGRVKDNRIGAILIERNKRQTHFVGEKIQEAVLVFLKDVDKETTPRIRFAVAESPIDGTSADSLIGSIESQLK